MPAMAADEVRAAISRRDEAALRALLHPYLHWTDATGTTVRGRTKVLAPASRLSMRTTW